MPLESLAVVGAGTRPRRALDRGARVAAAVAMARDLVNEPAGALTPQRLAEVAAEVAEREGLDLTVSTRRPSPPSAWAACSAWPPGSDGAAPAHRAGLRPAGRARGTVALVGKGITFDSGGLSIKTAEGMETMKTDMSGAAAVLAAMSALPALAPTVQGDRHHPGHREHAGRRRHQAGRRARRIRNGKTVEVLNTDAEGRLVLADGLSLAVEDGVDAIVDLATLTGAAWSPWAAASPG